MAEPKTKQNRLNVDEFIDTVADEQKRDDCRELVAMMMEATGEEARMWGATIVGFGKYRYKYGDGHENDWPVIGFSPRKDKISLYISAGTERFADLLKDLGKHKTGKGCVYVKKLDDVDRSVLGTLLHDATEAMEPQRVR